MNALNFSFENLPITVLVKDDAPWFIAAQVAKAIHLTNPSVAIRTLRNCERSKVTIDGRETNIISESGMYTLILRSQDAIKEGTPAFRFRVKVTDEILPAIRRTGRYESAQSALITTTEQYEIRKAIKSRAKNSSVHYQTVYNALYDYFKIASYKDLRHDQMKAALALIETCTLKPQLPAPKIPEGSIVIDEVMAERIVVFIYYWRYLFRDDLNLCLALLRRVKSPLAAHFWEAVNDLGLGFMEDALAKQGYSVKDLSCYQHWASQQPKRLTA